VGQYCNYSFNTFSRAGRSFCFQCLPLGGISGVSAFPFYGVEEEPLGIPEYLWVPDIVSDFL